MASEVRIYNLRIVPDKKVFQEVREFKETFINRFGKQALSRSKPHITLAHFDMDTEYLDQLLKAFNQLTSVSRFRLQVQGFDTFPNANVLFLNVLESQELIQVFAQIDIIRVRDLHRTSGSFHIPDKAHMTISKTRSRAMLDKSLGLFDGITYSREIEVNALTLLSRPAGKTWDWEHQMPLS